MTKFLVISAVVAGFLAVPAIADETEGHVMAFDRVANIIVLTDKTVWQLGADVIVPADLASGDRVLLDFVSEGEEGVTAILELHRLAAALPEGTDGGS
jgi:hypothetical protein